MIPLPSDPSALAIFSVVNLQSHSLAAGSLLAGHGDDLWLPVPAAPRVQLHAHPRAARTPARACHLRPRARRVGFACAAAAGCRKGPEESGWDEASNKPLQLLGILLPNL